MCMPRLVPLGQAPRTLLAAGIIFAMAFLGAPSVFAQSPTYGVGRLPTQAEFKAWDIAIGPDGRELPPGSGTAKAGTGAFSLPVTFPSRIGESGGSPIPYPSYQMA